MLKGGKIIMFHTVGGAILIIIIILIVMIISVWFTDLKENNLIDKFGKSRKKRILIETVFWSWLLLCCGMILLTFTHASKSYDVYKKEEETKITQELTTYIQSQKMKKGEKLLVLQFEDETCPALFDTLFGGSYYSVDYVYRDSKDKKHYRTDEAISVSDLDKYKELKKKIQMLKKKEKDKGK